MSDLKLLPGNEPTAFERQLLDAVAKESPSAEQRLRVREALGLPTVSLPPPPPAASKSALVKALAGGALAISAAAALWFLSSSTPSGAPRPQEAPPAPVAAVATAPQQPDPVPSVPIAELPLEAAPPVAGAAAATEKPVASSGARATPSQTPAASAKTGSDLGDQLRLIEAARAAVAARKPAAAATAIADYRSRFPRGAFDQEASVLQIQTLDLQGNHARAAELAKGFLARYPKSPHVAVVRRIAER